MADDRLFTYSIIGFFAGLFLFWKGFSWLKQKRLIENIPTSKIRSIAMGLVEIYGEVVPTQEKILKSPFTNKDCVYYKYIIEEYRRYGKHSRWVKIRDMEEGVPFYLKDNTGLVLVDPKGAKVDIPTDFEFKSTLIKRIPEEIKRFAKSNRMIVKGLLGFNRTLRFREYFLGPGDKSYVIGTAGDNPFVEEATVKHGVEDIMIQKGNKKAFYYISDKPETEILKKFRWKVIGGVFGGSLLTIGCLIIILIYLNIL